VGSFTAPSRRTSAQANPIAAAFNGPPRNQGQGIHGTRPSTTPATIAALQERIRALLPPQLAVFSRAFRSTFQVPDSTPSIAGLITEQRHRLWIEVFLGRLQSPQLQSQHQQARNA
jgi:hypothetical protein